MPIVSRLILGFVGYQYAIIPFKGVYLANITARISRLKPCIYPVPIS